MAANVDSAIGQLAADGARNFLIVTVPDLGKTPAAIAGGPAAEAGASALAAGFDTTLVNGSSPLLPSLSFLAAEDNLNLKVLDAYSLLDAIVAHPSTYGFTNVTTPCLVGLTVCSSPNQYLFWDDQHPTAEGQALVGEAALQTEEAPEPVTVILVGTGFLALGLIRRRSRR